MVVSRGTGGSPVSRCTHRRSAGIPAEKAKGEDRSARSVRAEYRSTAAAYRGSRAGSPCHVKASLRQLTLSSVIVRNAGPVVGTERRRREAVLIVEVAVG